MRKYRLPTNWHKYLTCPRCKATKGYPCLDLRNTSPDYEYHKVQPHDGRPLANPRKKVKVAQEQSN